MAKRAASYAFERLNACSRKEWATRRSNPCPVCQSHKWCRVDPEGRVALCMKQDAGGEPFGQAGDHLHVLDPRFFDEQAGDWQPPKPLPRPPKPHPFTPEERQRRNDAYQALLGELPSAEEHEQLAELRGAYPDAARLLGARLMPARGSRDASAILKTLRESEQSFVEVPGFGGRGKTTAAFPVGGQAIAFPTFSGDGLIEGLHLRLLDASGSKYIWFSGDDFGGVPRDAANDALPVSVYRSEGAADSAFILIAEGEKKAAAGADAFGCAAISVPGVTQWRAALAALKAIDPSGASAIRLAWDMDQDENEHVARALESFAKALEKEGRRVETGRWPLEQKGLDDALIAGGPKLIEWTSRERPPRAEVAEGEPKDLVIEDEGEEEPPWWRVEFQQGSRNYYTEDDGSLWELSPAKNGTQPPPSLVSSFVYRIAEVINLPESDEPRLLLDIRHQGRNLSMETTASARGGRKFAEALAGRMPYYHVTDGRPSGLSLLSQLSLRLGQTHAAEEIERHESGFDKKLENYRVPGWRIDAEGAHEEPASACPVGFGANGDEWPVPDTHGEKLRLAARAYADSWGALLPSKADLTIALAATLAGGPVAALANTSANPIVAFVGQSRTGKTTLLKRLRALHGQIDGEPINADNVTIAGAIGLAGKNRDSFALIDYLKVGNTVLKFVSAAFGAGESVSMTRERKLRVSRSLRGCFGLTAEDLKGARQSTINRLVPVQFAKRSNAEVEAADAAVARLEDAERGNGTSCLAMEAVRRCLAVRANLADAFREMQATASRKFDGVSRGKKLAGLIGVSVRIVGDMFRDLCGELPSWFATPEECMARVVGRHAAAEDEYKPATMVAERFNAARAAGDELQVESARWKTFGSSIESDVEMITGQRVSRDQVRCWAVRGGNEMQACLAVEPRKFLAALGMSDMAEKLAHDSLESEGMLLDVGWKHPGSPIISVYRNVTYRDRSGSLDEEDRQRSRPRLWLIKLDPSGDIASPDDGGSKANSHADAFGNDDPCEVSLAAPPAIRPEMNGHRNGSAPRQPNGRSKPRPPREAMLESGAAAQRAGP